MPALRIRISPPESHAPQPATLPLDNARHWVSPYEKAGAGAPVSVFVTQSVYLHAVIHATSEPDYEVGGILVGKWCADIETGQQFIVAAAALPARFTRQGSVFLTFTQDSLVDLHAKMDEFYPGKEIVGWYHTHPRIGVFLSHYDTWLHEHFFPEPWQVALVIEPHTSVGGFFIRQVGGELDSHQYYGFYELDGDFNRSIVNWNNLQQVSAAVEEKGEAQ